MGSVLILLYAQYWYAPNITSITPQEGPSTGGTTITIEGGAFHFGAVVTIGGNRCTSLNRIDGRRLTCITPSGTPGDAEVIVTNPDGQVDQTNTTFTYTAP